MNNPIIKHITFPLYYQYKKIPLLKALRELEKSQWYSQDELRTLQLRKFKDLLKHARENTAYYRDILTNSSISIDSINTWEDFRRIPILTKETAKYNIEKLVSKNASKEIGRAHV